MADEANGHTDYGDGCVVVLVCGYADYFPHAPPACSTVLVARLPLDVLIEVEAIAAI